MNSKTAVSVTLAIACILGSMLPVNAASTYQVLKPNQGLMQPNTQLKLAPLHVKCAAAGSPDFTSEGLLTNDGARTIPTGSEVRWTLNGHSDIYKFSADLAPHKTVAFNLHFTTGAAVPCTAKFVNAASTYQVLKPNQGLMQPNTQLRLAPLHVKCASAGSPDFTSEGLLTNDGARTIPTGSEVRWTLNGHSDIYKFSADLAPHKTIAFNLHFTTGAAIPCTTKFVKSVP